MTTEESGEIQSKLDQNSVKLEILAKDITRRDRFQQWLAGVVIALLITTGAGLIHMYREIGVITANRCTSLDCKELAIAIAEVRNAIPSEIPPSWFRRQVDGLEVSVKEHERRLNAVEKENRK